MHTTLPTRPAPTRQRAFTLAEVMVSMAMVLLIVYGVSQVFKMSSDTVGAQQGLASIIRDHRAAQATMSQDMRNCLPDSPLFLISSHIAYNGSSGKKASYRSAQEELDDADGDPFTYVINGQTQPRISPAQYVDRNPRLDKVAFFVRDTFHRQTSNDNAMVSTDTSNEAYVWYGHTRNVNGVYPSEQYAPDRVLGRYAILMRDNASLAGQGALRINNPVPNASPSDPPLGPIDRYNIMNDQTLNARYDVANVTVDQWRVRANAHYNRALPGSALDWFLPMDDDAPGSGTFQWRFRCNTKLARPFTSAQLASSVPYFVGSCTQFIVEYAGDFLNQDPSSGAVTPGAGAKPGVSAYMDSSYNVVRGVTDGQLDFIVEPGSGQTRRIRWYGLPRDVTADGIIGINDVVPLRDVLEAAGFNGIGVHEKVLPPQRLSQCPGNDYMRYNGAIRDFAYVCAWHNDAPMMIRITLKIDDPAQRLQDGQWYEYVLSR